MLNPENDQTQIMRREGDYKRPRSVSHWLIERPLPLLVRGVVVTDVPYRVRKELKE